MRLRPHRRPDWSARLAGLALLAPPAASSDGNDPAPAAPVGDASRPADRPRACRPFGAACAAVPANGAGSFTGMATDPVATAASNNPLLSTLVDRGRRRPASSTP